MDEIKIRLRIFMAVFLVVMLLGTFGFMYIEGLSIADAFYFSIVTITTVGYGDIHPATQLGKILAIVLIICGVGTFLGVVANATEMILSRREKEIRMQKVHMVMGLFFSEVGTKLLTYFSRFDPQLDLIQKDFNGSHSWSEHEFSTLSKRFKSYEYKVDTHRGKLEDLRSFLEGKSNFLLRLLENPILLEHEYFTELLRAVFHLREELLSRDDMKQLPDTDYSHLAGDIRRAYILLSQQWLDYMHYLKDNYPYLFSLATRMNPFNQQASPIVT
jgi:voltage-gated potassium channel